MHTILILAALACAQDAEQYHKSGKEKQEKGNYTGAIADFDKAIALDPQWAGPYLFRGECKFETGDLAGALKDFDKAVELKPDHAIVYEDRAKCKHEMKDFKGAVADLTKALELERKDRDPMLRAMMYVNRARSRRELGDLDGAIDDYSQAIKLNPREERYLLLRGLTRNDNKKDYDGAIADLTAYLNENPGSDLAYWGRATARQAKGDYKAALEDWNKVVELLADKTNWDVYRDRGLAREALGDIAGATKDFLHVEANPFVPKGLLRERGEAQYKQKNYDNAIRFFTAAIACDAKDLRSLVNRGYCYHDKKQYELAIADYSDAIRISPDFAPYWFERGLSKYERGDLDAALEDFRKAIALSPDYEKAKKWLDKARPQARDAHIGKGDQLVKKKDYQGAAAEYEAAIKLQPEEPAAWHKRGCARYWNGEHDKALPDFDQVVKLDRKNANGWIMKGYAHYKLKQWSDCVKAFKTAVRLDEKLESQVKAKLEEAEKKAEGK